MKKIFLTFAIILAGHSIYAQTNTFPTSGNVGIGTGSPAYKLDVVGDVNGSNYRASGLFSIQNSGKRWDLNYDSPGGYMFLDEWGSARRLVIQNGSGNVGIGTTSPNAKLEVKGTMLTGSGAANLDPNVANLNFLANSMQMVIGWNRTAYGGEAAFINNQGSGNPGGFAFYNHDNNNHETQLMWIRGDGNIGIGTTAPDAKLAVNGTIHTKEIKVDLTGWPDYVFKPNYTLSLLTEVKAYIDKNQHLPEMPSEQEVAANGINLGEMNKLLTKKVEELTLYAIDQQGQIELLKAQQEKNKQQEARIEVLERALLNLTSK